MSEVHTGLFNLNDCPQCGAPLDAWTALDERGAPKTGDLSICVCCVSLLRFEADQDQLKIRTLTHAETIAACMHASVRLNLSIARKIYESLVAAGKIPSRETLN